MRMEAEMDWQTGRTGADEEAALSRHTKDLREANKEMARQNTALSALLAKRRTMVEELRQRINDMDAENAQISREVAEILGSPA